MINFQKIKKWIIENYQDKNDEKVENLIWLDKRLDNKNKLDWAHVDTVDFDITSIPRRKNLIIDVKMNPKEIERRWQSLSLEK